MRKLFHLVGQQRHPQTRGDGLNKRALDIRVLQDFWAEACSLARLRQPAAIAWITRLRHSDKKHRFELLEMDDRLFCQRIIFGNCRDCIVRRDGSKLQTAFFDWLAQSDKTKINFSIFQGAKLIAATHVEEIDRDGGERTLERCQGDRQEVVKQVRDVANIKRRYVVTTEMPDGLNNFFAQTENAFRVGQERLPLGRQTYMRFAPIEKSHSQFLLEAFDLSRERGLREAQLFRALRKAEGLCDRHKIA